MVLTGAAGTPEQRKGRGESERKRAAPVAICNEKERPQSLRPAGSDLSAPVAMALHGSSAERRDREETAGRAVRERPVGLRSSGPDRPIDDLSCSEHCCTMLKMATE